MFFDNTKENNILRTLSGSEWQSVDLSLLLLDCISKAKIVVKATVIGKKKCSKFVRLKCYTIQRVPSERLCSLESFST